MHLHSVCRPKSLLTGRPSWRLLSSFSRASERQLHLHNKTDQAENFYSVEKFLAQRLLHSSTDVFSSIVVLVTTRQLFLIADLMAAKVSLGIFSSVERSFATNLWFLFEFCCLFFIICLLNYNAIFVSQFKQHVFLVRLRKWLIFQIVLLKKVLIFSDFWFSS